MDRARCPTYGGDCWVSLHLFINGTCCKDGTTIVVDRSSYLTVQPNLRAVKCQHALATCIIFTNASSIERVGDCNFSGSLSLQAPNIVSLEILPQGRPKKRSFKIVGRTSSSSISAFEKKRASTRKVSAGSLLARVRDPSNRLHRMKNLQK